MLPIRQWIVRFLSAFFTLLYGSLAASYDFVAWSVSLGRWKSWVLACLPTLRGPRVLELGHGPGHLQVGLHEKSVQTFGIDLSGQMGKLAKSRLSKHGFPANLVRAEGQKLPFSNKSFDQIAATFPTEYISARKSLREIHRVAADNGDFVVILVAWITGKTLLERLMAALFRVTGQTGEWDGAFSRLVAEAGFDVEEKTIKLKGSKVLLINAEKLGS